MNREQEEGGQTMKKVGQVVKHFLTKFWIWIVAITLYGVAITGTKMTVFRIVYMALFILFVLCFQVFLFCFNKLPSIFELFSFVFSYRSEFGEKSCLPF